MVSNGFVQTGDDGDINNSGDQTTEISFVGPLDPMFADIPGGASISFSGLELNTDATTLDLGNNVSVISGTTTGGQFSLFDDDDMLLLQGDVGDFSISNLEGSGTGNFVSVGNTTFTAGSLLPLINPNSGLISLSLIQIETNGQPGFEVIDGTIQPFIADASGQISAAIVPEPTSLPVLIMGFTLLASYRNRRSAC